MPITCKLHANHNEACKHAGYNNEMYNYGVVDSSEYIYDQLSLESQRMVQKLSHCKSLENN